LDEKSEKRYDTVQNYNNRSNEKIEELRTFANNILDTVLQPDGKMEKFNEIFNKMRNEWMEFSTQLTSENKNKLVEF
jgi:hypothetical protein